MMKVMLAIPFIELILANGATLIPFSVDEIGDKVPMIVIFIVLFLLARLSASSVLRAARPSTRYHSRAGCSAPR